MFSVTTVVGQPGVGEQPNWLDLAFMRVSNLIETLSCRPNAGMR